MRNKIFRIKAIAILFLALFLHPAYSAVITPYEELVSTDEYYNGATFEIAPGLFSKEDFSRDIEIANSLYNINTITIYGFENLNDDVKSYIFSELSRLNMKIVIRIEAYNSDFSFKKEDASYVLSIYRDLLEFCSAMDRRDTVAYFAINMPVDDIAVQKNAGGLNTRPWINAQVVYAEEIVRSIRETCLSFGWSDPKLYLSVFYGWDNTFKTPSYESANADGYFINNYTYPKNGGLLTASADPMDIINADRLRGSMEIYKKQYGSFPVVMEWGFHTLEFNNGIRPNQTAGLVLDKDAKRVAVRAMVDFYKENYPFVRGCLYFGYNLLKQEGNPPALLDWCLSYPLEEGWTPAYEGRLSQDARLSGESVILNQHSSIEYDECPEIQMIAISYTSSSPFTLTLFSDGRRRGDFLVPSGKDAIYAIPVISADGATFKIELKEGDGVEVDSLFFSSVLEAEYAINAKAQLDSSASNRYSAGSLSGESNAITFAGVRGGERITFTYKADASSRIYLLLDGRRASFAVPPTNGDFRSITVSVPVYRNADLSIYSDNNTFYLDSIRFLGIPSGRN